MNVSGGRRAGEEGRKEDDGLPGWELVTLAVRVPVGCGSAPNPGEPPCTTPESTRIKTT